MRWRERHLHEVFLGNSEQRWHIETSFRFESLLLLVNQSYERTPSRREWGNCTRLLLTFMPIHQAVREVYVGKVLFDEEPEEPKQEIVLIRTDPQPAPPSGAFASASSITRSIP